MSSRARGALVALAALGGALGLLLADAGRRREAGRDAHAVRAAIAEASGSSDLALSSGARWLRHPTSAEPAAGCAAPTCLDVDPAGLALPPARPTFGGERALVRVPDE